MLDKINALKEEISASVASNLQEVEELRIKYLSKKGSISLLMADFRTVPADETGVGAEDQRIEEFCNREDFIA